MPPVFYPALADTIATLPFAAISSERLQLLEEMAVYLLAKIKKGEEIRLNFICTHNSRRSQFSQVWAQTAAVYYGIDATCYSGGVEVTAFNERAVAALKRDGFKVVQKGEDNPVYFVFPGEDTEPIITFSKLYDDALNANKGFAAVMTCDHADENCPYIPGADKRFPLRYEDPKAFDDTEEEAARYIERSQQIGAELVLLFKNISERR